MAHRDGGSGIVLTAPDTPGQERVFTDGALSFLAALHRRFSLRRRELLDQRQVRRGTVALTGTMDFLPETTQIRDGDWRVAPIPEYLADRRVEITGPTDRKMTINALNSGAERLARRSGGRQHPRLAQHRRGPDRV